MMIRFKEPHMQTQILQVSMVLQQVVYDFTEFSRAKFGIIPTITRIWDPVQGESGVHIDRRAVDIRDRHDGRNIYTPHQVAELLNYINTKWERSDGFETMIHHSFGGGPEHFHIQIALSTKAYEIKKNDWHDWKLINTINWRETKMGNDKIGIENLKELADFVLALGNGVSASLADGKISLSDLANFHGVLFTVMPAFNGIDKVDDEFFAMTPEQKEELKAHIAAKLSLDPSHEKIEGIVETVLAVIIDLKQLIAALVGVKAA